MPPLAGGRAPAGAPRLSRDARAASAARALQRRDANRCRSRRPSATRDAAGANGAGAGDNGGGGGGGAHGGGSARVADPSVGALREQVEELRQLVSAQQAALQQLAAASPAQQQLPADGQAAAALDRRLLGAYDARFSSTTRAAVPAMDGTQRILPERIILVRHAQSEGNVDNLAYTNTPDPQVPLTDKGREEARAAGVAIRRHMEAACRGREGGYKLFFFTSPYRRSFETYEGIREAFAPSQVVGVQEEVQLREQDFGNLQNLEATMRSKQERLRFGRFFYRFPNGESGADVYDRITIFEDHLVRDINAGRFQPGCSLVLVTHGLALRVFLMRWFHWTVEQFLEVYNPPNADPVVLERIPPHELRGGSGSIEWMHTKSLYRLHEGSREPLRGLTPDMCVTRSTPPGSSSDEDADEGAG